MFHDEYFPNYFHDEYFPDFTIIVFAPFVGGLIAVTGAIFQAGARKGATHQAGPVTGTLFQGGARKGDMKGT